MKKEFKPCMQNLKLCLESAMINKTKYFGFVTENADEESNRNPIINIIAYPYKQFIEDSYELLDDDLVYVDDDGDKVYKIAAFTHCDKFDDIEKDLAHLLLEQE